MEFRVDELRDLHADVIKYLCGKGWIRKTARNAFVRLEKVVACGEYAIRLQIITCCDGDHDVYDYYVIYSTHDRTFREWT
jgi:hypothetical protein